MLCTKLAKQKVLNIALRLSLSLLTAANEYAVRLSLNDLELTQSQMEMKKLMAKREEKMHSFCEYYPTRGYSKSMKLTTSAQFRKDWGGKSACSTSNPMAMMHRETIMMARMQLIHMKAANGIANTKGFLGPTCSWRLIIGGCQGKHQEDGGYLVYGSKMANLNIHFYQNGELEKLWEHSKPVNIELHFLVYFCWEVNFLYGK